MEGYGDGRHIGIDEIAPAKPLCRYCVFIGFSIVRCEDDDVASQGVKVLGKKVHILRHATRMGIVRIRTEQYSHSV